MRWSTALGLVLGLGLAAAGTAFAAGAGELSLRVGPPQVGSGGSNPLSLPPVNPTEYELEYCTSNNFEMSLALTPGLLFGGRSRMASGVYVGAGGGLILDANGLGPGVYSALGYTHGLFNIEMKQAIGYDTGKRKVLSPYALRMGISIFFR